MMNEFYFKANAPRLMLAANHDAAPQIPLEEERIIPSHTGSIYAHNAA